MQGSPDTTLLFTDIEGSTRLWEQDGERMSRALAEHDALSRARSRAQPRHGREDDRRRDVRRLRRSARRAQRHGRCCSSRWTIPRRPTASRSACAAACTRHRRAPRTTIFRQPGQPCGADHEGRARRPGTAVPGGRRSRAGTAAGRGFRCAIWARSGCATSPRPSASISSCTRDSGRISPRCARSKRRPTTCRSRLRRSSGASASSPKSSACSEARAC